MCQIIRLKCRASLGTAALRTACFTLGDKLIFKFSNFDYKLINCTRCGINNELFSCSWYFSFNDFFSFLFIYSLLFCIIYSQKYCAMDFFNPNVYGTHQNCGIMAKIFCNYC
uniref:Uncharacterized protein n=1 Tax=Macrostomum lignano TaxID=282301 RepID=A0A1I8JJX5_9PLAT